LFLFGAVDGMDEPEDDASTSIAMDNEPSPVDKCQDEHMGWITHVADYDSQGVRDVACNFDSLSSKEPFSNLAPTR
jgi:hypothetical protein